MRIIFFGTPDYVVSVADRLHKVFKTKDSNSGIVAVVTQPPRPVGRKKQLKYSPIDSWAHKKNISTFYKPEDLLKKNVQADVGILASYGEIVSNFVIKHFKIGILNIHPSLLPKFRGASPVPATILTQEKAGSTIIKIDEELDHGPIISQFEEEVGPLDTTESFRAKLFERSGEVLATLLPAYIRGKITPREQNHQEATFTRQLKKDDGFIPAKYLESTLSDTVRHSTLQGQAFKGSWKLDFLKPTYNLQLTTYNLERFIRAMQPWPGAWTHIKLKSQNSNVKTLRLKILKAHLEKLVPNDYCLVPELVQLEGKNPVSWKQFSQAYPNSQFI